MRVWHFVSGLFLLVPSLGRQDNRATKSLGEDKGKTRHLKGHVKFDCKLDGGKGHVRGEATFSHCH